MKELERRHVLELEERKADIVKMKTDNDKLHRTIDRIVRLTTASDEELELNCNEFEFLEGALQDERTARTMEAEATETLERDDIDQALQQRINLLQTVGEGQPTASEVPPSLSSGDGKADVSDRACSNPISVAQVSYPTAIEIEAGPDTVPAASAVRSLSRRQMQQPVLPDDDVQNICGNNK